MEQIYTIPINEAFEASIEKPELGCPFCRLYKMLEKSELELMLGASMMEPEIREKTNKSGFCADHYQKMFAFGNNKLPLALILESHLQVLSEQMKTSKLLPAFNGQRAAKELDKMSESCYLCEKLETNFHRMMNNAVYLWETDASFKEKCSKQPCFCLKHYGMFLNAAQNLKRKDYAELYRCISPIEEKHLQELKNGISSFVKQFDYRYENNDGNIAKHAIENAVFSLTGEEI